MYKNIEVSTWRGELSVKNSFTTLHTGNNLYSLTLSEFREAVESLSDVLRVDLSEARVTRADIAGNIELCQYEIVGGEINIGGVAHDAGGRVVPVPDYLASLGTLPRFNRKNVNGETLTYYLKSNTVGKGETLQLEDKIAEMRAHKIEIPRGATGKNIVRVELSVRGKVKLEELNGGAVTVATLTGDRFYKAMCDRLHERYTSIKPITNMIPVSRTPLTRDALLIELAGIGLAHCDGAYINRLVRAMPRDERGKCNQTLIPSLRARAGVTSGTYYEELTRGVEHLYAEAMKIK
jgi:hypothetical protein